MDDLDLVQAIPGAALNTRVINGSADGARFRLTCLGGDKIVPGDGDRPATLMTESYFLMLSWAQTGIASRLRTGVESA